MGWGGRVRVEGRGGSRFIHPLCSKTYLQQQLPNQSIDRQGYREREVGGGNVGRVEGGVPSGINWRL